MAPLSITLAHKQKQILVVDDAADTRTLLAFHLQQAGYSVRVAANCQEAWAQIEGYGLPHLALIDLHLAELSGVTLAQWLSQQHLIPVFLLSTPVPQPVEIPGVDLLVKPLNITHMLAQVEQRLPDFITSSLVMQEVRVDERLTLNFAAHYAILDHRQIALTPVESCLLALLFQHRGRVLAQHFLSEKIAEVNPSTRHLLLTYIIYHLRQKLETHRVHRRYIRTVPRKGYVMPTASLDRQPAGQIALPKRLSW